MNTPESLDDQSAEAQRESTGADLLNRTIAKSIDFIIVIALYEIIPKAGYLAGLAYLLIADGLFEGRSAGKRLLGLKVIVSRSAGTRAPCGIRDSIIRNAPFAVGYLLYGILGAIPLIGWLLSFIVVAGIVLFESLVILGSEEGMRLGDDLAKTRVVQEKLGE
ncbi:MAG: hypothetical protein JSU90_09910 [Nitrospiraceae bacterium]|nr:MAG: hypothetical protein JSU90_09910 [Nitrospiraceae bacterium]